MAGSPADITMEADIPAALRTPNVSLHGEVNNDMLSLWIDAVRAITASDAPVVVSLTTTGGDADIGRRIADDVRLLREQTGRQTLIIGKTVVYSAGATIFGGFVQQDRWLTRDAMLMVHGRKLSKTVDYCRSLRAERVGVEALLAEIDAGLAAETREFQRLIQGSDITADEIQMRTLADWYIPADEALRRGLIAGLI